MTSKEPDTGARPERAKCDETIWVSTSLYYQWPNQFWLEPQKMSLQILTWLKFEPFTTRYDQSTVLTAGRCSNFLAKWQNSSKSASQNRPGQSLLWNLADFYAFMAILALIGWLSLSNSCNNEEGVKIVMLDGYLCVLVHSSAAGCSFHPACLMLYTMPGLIQDTVHLANHPTLN